MSSRYRPLPFGGRIAFVASQQTLDLGVERGWADLAGRGMEIHAVPGNQADVYNEYVGTSVDVITRISEARSRENGRCP